MRNSTGTYSLPYPNVQSGTAISSTWANGTLGDLKNEITDSLSRSGKGEMLAPLKVPDGSAAIPSFSFTSDADVGFYLAADSDLRVAVASSDMQKWTPSSILMTRPTTVTTTVSNSAALTATGNGTGVGVAGTGGATGAGVTGTGGSTSGDGGVFTGTGGGKGVTATGQGSGAGVAAQGGATGAGVTATGGSTSGVGLSATGGPNSGGVTGTGTGTGTGVAGTGGATSGNGVSGTGTANGHGVVGTGGSGTTTASNTTLGVGVLGTGGGSGPGVRAVGGSGGSGGDGLVAIGGGTAGRGINAQGGTGQAGALITAGTAATATTAQNALRVAAGYVAFENTANPNANVAFSNTITPMHFAKVFGTITTGGASNATVSSGLNISSITFALGKMEVNFASNFLSANYVALPTVPAADYKATVTAKTASKVTIYVEHWDSAAKAWGSVDLSTNIITVDVVVFGAQ